MRIAIIGGGVMGEVFVKRLLAQERATAKQIVVSDVSASRREFVSRQYGVKALADNGKAVAGADLVILAVKPQDLSPVMEEIKGLSSRQTVLSIVAGVTLSELCQGLNHFSVLRAMPNMAGKIGEGVTVWTASAETTPKQKELGRSVLKALGLELYVDQEKYLDMATALSGSGPAYVFLFIEALVDAGVHIGLPRDTAQSLVVQTVLGSTHLLEKTGKHPAELRNMITSPAGTTTEALLQLERGGFRSLLVEAVSAAYEKARRI